MPQQPVAFNYNRQQLMLNYPFIKTFLFTNGTGSPISLSYARLMGKLFSTQGNVAPTISTNTDGSQQPIGILADTYTVAVGATIPVDVYIRGEFNKQMVVLDAGDTWSSTVMTEGVGDDLESMLIRNSELIPIETTDISNYNNTFN